MTGPKKKRRVARSPEDLAAKKDLILDAAMSLLVDKGYTKTTISDVAQTAGIGRGTVYWHFASKDDLFFALIAREIETMVAGMDTLVEPVGPALDTIDGLIRMAFEYYQQAGPFFQAMLSIIGGAGEELEQRMVALAAELYGKYNRVLADLLDQGKAEGAVHPDLDSEITAAAITVLLDAMYLQVGMGLIPNDADRLTAAITHLIHHGTTTLGADHA
jgi:AcrR family transcriptional regulator